MKMEQELTLMEETLMKMGRHVISMHTYVITMLETPDRQCALEVIQADERINQLEEEINDQAVELLALLSPVASDLRKVVANIKIATELERMGDYAKNIARFLLRYEKLAPCIMAYAQAMEKGFVQMLQETLDCYLAKDAETAFELPQKDAEIEALYQEVKQTLIREDKAYVSEHIFEISSMLRNIERSKDHTKNICEHIIYMVKGQHYDFG